MNALTSDRLLEISNDFQSTLDIEELLKKLIKYVKYHEDITVNGALFECHKEGEIYLQGDPSGLKFIFTVMVKAEKIGDLFLYISPQSAREPRIIGMEQLVKLMALPLRNAILHQLLVKKSFVDTVTGVGNRRALEANLAKEMESAQRYGEKLCMIMIDVDSFKEINDTHGHLVGDEILKIIAHSLQKTVRLSDAVYRFGGDEFVVLLRKSGPENALLTAGRIRTVIAKSRIPVVSVQLNISVSLGVACLCDGETSKELFERADSALYLAKRQGKNRVVLDLNPVSE